MPILLLLLAAATLGGPEEDAAPDARTIVLTLDWRGGRTRPRARQEPYLAIRRDGTVRVAEPFAAEVPPLESRIAADEVEALLTFVEKQGLFTFHAGKVRRQIAGDGNVPRIEDAARTVVGAWNRGKLHEVEFEALESFARRYPGVADLQRLQEVVARLRALRKRVIAGGHKALAALAALATEQLRKKDPCAKPLTGVDLVGARLAPEGARCFRFHRTRGPASDSVSIEVPANGDPKVTVQLTRG